MPRVNRNCSYNTRPSLASARKLYLIIQGCDIEQVAARVGETRVRSQLHRETLETRAAKPGSDPN